MPCAGHFMCAQQSNAARLDLLAGFRLLPSDPKESFTPLRTASEGQAQP